MQRYFEVNNDIENLFWEINVANDQVYIHHGKIGLQGVTAQIAFPTSEEAEKHCELFIENLKNKKEVREIETKSVLRNKLNYFQIINEQDKIYSFDLQCDKILYYEGNLEIEEDFTDQFIENYLYGFDIEYVGVVINGDLTVKRRIRMYRTNLEVRGFTKAETLEAADGHVILANGEFKYFVYADYNHGILEIGKIQVPLVINNDHNMQIVEALNATFISLGGNDSGFVYKYEPDDFEEVFVEEILNISGNMSIEKLYKQLHEGKNIFKNTHH